MWSISQIYWTMELLFLSISYKWHSRGYTFRKAGLHYFKVPFCPKILFSNVFIDTTPSIPCSINQEGAELVPATIVAITVVPWPILCSDRNKVVGLTAIPLKQICLYAVDTYNLGLKIVLNQKHFLKNWELGCTGRPLRYCLHFCWSGVEGTEERAGRQHYGRYLWDTPWGLLSKLGSPSSSSVLSSPAFHATLCLDPLHWLPSISEPLSDCLQEQKPTAS